MMDTRYTTFFMPGSRLRERGSQLVLSLIVPAALGAQPTLQSSDMGTVGSTFEYQQAEYITLANAGPNQTWDLSNTVPTNQLTFN